MTVVDVLIRGGKQEISHVIDFATTPVGPFTTLDQMITTARRTVRDVGSQAGVTRPGRYRGQVGTRVEAIRGRFPKLRRY